MFDGYNTLDLSLGGLVSVLVIYLIHSIVNSDPNIKTNGKERKRHFVPKKMLGDKEMVMLKMLEEEIDTLYDYSSTIRVAGPTITTVGTAKASFVITDPDLKDNPIIFASSEFSALTGYSKEEIENRNCRFLQGPGTDPEDLKEIRLAVEQRKEASLMLLNYKKDGTAFTNQFFLCPLYSPDKKTVCYFIGVQKEVDMDNQRHENGYDGENAGYRCFFWL